MCSMFWKDFKDVSWIILHTDSTLLEIPEQLQTEKLVLLYIFNHPIIPANACTLSLCCELWHKPVSDKTPRSRARTIIKQSSRRRCAGMTGCRSVVVCALCSGNSSSTCFLFCHRAWRMSQKDEKSSVHYEIFLLYFPLMKQSGECPILRKTYWFLWDCSESTRTVCVSMAVQMKRTLKWR